MSLNLCRAISFASASISLEHSDETPYFKISDTKTNIIIRYEITMEAFINIMINTKWNDHSLASLNYRVKRV